MKPREINDTKAIQLSIKKMEQEPLTIAEFIQAVTDNTYKRWHVYKIALSAVLSEFKRGRAVPIKKRLPKHDNAFKIGQAYDREKNGLQFIPQLPLHKCKTRNEKLTMINQADIPTQVKADLIIVNYK